MHVALVLLGASLSVVLEQLEIGVGFKLPLYQHIITLNVEPGQLTYPGLLTIMLSRSFSIGE